MKLALVSAKFPFGGKEPYLHAELRALAPFFDEIVIFPTSPETSDVAFSEISAAVVRRGLFAPATLREALAALILRPRRSVTAVAALMLGSYRPSVKLKNLAIIPAGLGLGFRLHRGGFDHVHSYWLSTPASVAFLAARVAGIAWSSTGHLWDIYENNALATKLTSASFVRAISERGRRDLLATRGCASAAISVVHVGVDIPESPIERAAVTRPFAFLCAANLVLKKGHADLFAALANLSRLGIPFHCTLAGDGELRNTLSAQVHSLRLDGSVTFRGHVAHATLLAEMRAGYYDAMVLASIERAGGLMEGIPVALMEAMALGIPTVSTATGSINELIDDTCGRVVPQGNADALAGALAELAADSNLRGRLARAGYERVLSDFNVRRVALSLAELIGANT